MRNTFVVSVGLIILCSCAASSVAPIAVPLTYKPMANPAEFPAVHDCARISRVDVEDRRNEKSLGVRFLQEKQDQHAVVTASSDVAAWVQSGAEASLRQAGVTPGTGPVLHLLIDSIKTAESVYHRAEFTARISITAQVAGPSSVCWTGSAEGISENYGYAGSAENYQETLNHALDRAVIRLLESTEFQNAACSCAGASSPPAR